MGNMGFPVITRLGINQFWYNHWINDFSYKYQSKATRTAIESIDMYFKFGVTLLNSFNVSNYWFPTTVKKNAILKIKDNKSLYFRRKFVENTKFNVKVSWDYNKTVGEYFPMRTWFMRYSNWTVILTFWFKPIKTKPTNSVLVNNLVNTRRSVIINNNNKNVVSLKRLNLVKNFAKNHKYVF